MTPIRAIVYTLAASALPLCGQLTSDDLVNNSPFIPDGWTENGGRRDEPGNAPPQQYEFRGVYSLGGVFFVNVIDKSTGRGQWTQVGGESNGIKPLRWDPETKTVSVMINGQSMDLTMPQPGVHSGGVPTAVNSVASRQMGPNSNQPPQTPQRPTTTVRRVNRIPPPPPPPGYNRQNGSSMAGVPRAPAAVRTQGGTFDSSSPGGSFANNSSSNNGVYTGDPTVTPPPEVPAETTTPGGAPPPPPNFIPEIPPEIQALIKKRQAPGGG